jgi:hypothetical protein
VDAARESARALLSQQRENLVLWAAYAAAEAEAGRFKVPIAN